jgi:D-aminoacyl-tRNA deacylase
MKFVIQRVANAQLSIDDKEFSKIEVGFLVYIGISALDTLEIASKMVKKLVQMRIFEDDQGKINCSLDQVNGSLLLVSQFTLYADCKKGNRPSFITAARPEIAIPIYDYIVDCCRETVVNVQTGVFGAEMNIISQNSGPFTIILDSEEL